MDPKEVLKIERRDSSHLCTENATESEYSKGSSPNENSNRLQVHIRLEDIEEGRELELDDETFHKWARENFQVPVCQYFIPDRGSKKKDACKCGRTKPEHPEIQAELPEGTKWSAKEHCRLTPTTSFGTLDFINEDSIIMPKFIRVGTTITNPDAKYIIPESNLVSIKTLLLDHWKVPHPGLLISVIGLFFILYQKYTSQGVTVVVKIGPIFRIQN